MRRIRAGVIGSTTTAVVLSTGALWLAGAAHAAPLVDNPAAGAYVPTPATRLLDTRVGQRGRPAAAVPARGTVTVDVTGSAGVPAAGVAAVALTLTVTQPTAGGYLILYPGGAARPATSTLNFTAGRTVANASVVTPDADGQVSIYNSSAGSVQIVVDESGYYSAGSTTEAGAFVPVVARRALDTRAGTGVRAGPVPARGSVTTTLTGRDGVPASGVSAVVMNLTATGVTANGYLSAHAAGTPTGTSTLNFAAGVTDANLTVVALDRSGRATIENNSARPVHVIGDVLGYLRSGSPVTAGMTAVDDLQRLLDTRIGLGASKRPVPAHGTVTVRSSDLSPGHPLSTLIVHVTATDVTAGGYVQAYGDTALRPPTSVLNLVPGRSTSDVAFVQRGPSGAITLYNASARPIDLVVDSQAATLVGPPEIQTVPTENAFHATGVSCASPTSCVAVGQVARRDGGRWSRFDGTRWSEPAAFPGGGLLDGDLAVSCPSTTFCLATNSVEESVFDGTAWSTATQSNTSVYVEDAHDLACATDRLCLLAAEATNGRSMMLSYRDGWVRVADPPLQITALSCGAATCTAVGASLSDATPSASTFDGTSWSTPRDLPLTAKDIACAADGCVVVGRPDDAVTSPAPTESVVYVDGRSSTPVALPALRVGGDLSCVSTTDCTWLDDDVSTRFDGQRWSAAEPVHAGSPRGFGAVISCAGAGSCQAVVAGGAVMGYAGQWAATPSFPGIPVAVACASSTSCRSVDVYGTVTAWDGTSWPATSERTGLDPASAIDCVSVNRCVAVGLVDGSPAATAWDGADWTTPASLPGLSSVADVSCAGPAFCIAVGQGATAVADRFDGAEWSTTDVGSTFSSLQYVSCASSSLCAATGSPRNTSSQDVLTFDGNHWRDHPGQVGTSFGPVSCAKGDTRCILATDYSDTYAFTGTSWVLLNHGTRREVDALDCSPGGDCVAGGTFGSGYSPDVTTLDGGLWTEPTVVPGGGYTVGDLSCPTSAWCAAVPALRF